MQQTWNSDFRKVLHWLIGINLAVFAVQMMMITWAHSYWIQNYFSLSIPRLMDGYLWTVVTYSFLHREGLWHIAFNLLVIYLVGRALEPNLTGKRLLTLYLVSAVGGGLLWLAVKFGIGLVNGTMPSVPVVGASAAAYGLIIYFCALQPNQPITLLVFFILPVTVKPKWIAAFLVAFDACGMLFFEIPGNNAGQSSIAHSAHLGGMAGAYLLYHFVGSRNWQFGSSPAVKTKSEGWIKKRKREPVAATGGKFTLQMSNRKELRQELDRILDKINEQGFGSLSDEEKRTLDKAREVLG